MRAAATPAPNPLSMLTTSTPGAHAVSIGAARPAPRRRRRSPRTSAPRPPAARSARRRRWAGPVHARDDDHHVGLGDARGRRRGRGEPATPTSSTRRQPTPPPAAVAATSAATAPSEVPAVSTSTWPTGAAARRRRRTGRPRRRSVGPALSTAAAVACRPGWPRRARSHRRAGPRGRPRSAPASFPRRTQPRGCRCARRGRGPAGRSRSAVRRADVPSAPDPGSSFRGAGNGSGDECREDQMRQVPADQKARSEEHRRPRRRRREDPGIEWFELPPPLRGPTSTWFTPAGERGGRPVAAVRVGLRPGPRGRRGHSRAAAAPVAPPLVLRGAGVRRTAHRARRSRTNGGDS